MICTYFEIPQLSMGSCLDGHPASVRSGHGDPASGRFCHVQADADAEAARQAAFPQHYLIITNELCMEVHGF